MIIRNDPPSEDRLLCCGRTCKHRLIFPAWIDDGEKLESISIKQPVVSFSYLFSGGYSKPAMYPETALALFAKKSIAMLSHLPSWLLHVFVGLTPEWNRTQRVVDRHTPYFDSIAVRWDPLQGHNRFYHQNIKQLIHSLFTASAFGSWTRLCNRRPA